MVARLLGDPTYFPIEFRRWLKDYIENSDIRVTQDQIIGGGSPGSGDPTGLPPGMIVPFAGSNYGQDCLPCNGAAISRVNYPELFEAIGVTWGNGDGTSTFNVPDLRDRALYGAGSTITLGTTDGKSLGNRGPSHNHTVSGNTSSGGDHSHGWSGSIGGGGHEHGYYAPAGSVLIQRGTSGNYDSAANYSMNHPQTDGGGGHSHSVSGSVGSGGSHSHSFSGSTSGNSSNRDAPSWAGVLLVITTGRTP